MPDEHPWRLHIEARLEKLAELESGWDSYGARPIAPAAIEACRKFLSSLSVMTVVFPELEMPAVVPTCNGGVEVEWNPGDRTWASVEFGATGAVEACSTDAGVEYEYDSEHPNA